MGKRGLSADEKKQRLKKIFHDSKEPYTLKQIEKLGSKAGVTSMSIKGILEEMVSDSIVDMDKIGSTNWFWSFPSKEINALEAKAKKIEDEIDATEKKIEKAKAQKKSLVAERKPNETRTKLLEKLRDLEKQRESKKRSLDELEANDPAKAVEIVKNIDKCKEAANRWTDNTWELISYLKKKYMKNTKEASQMLGIKDDFDYPVYQPPKKRGKKGTKK